MKKFVSIALAAMLIIAMAGCSQSEAPAATTAAPAQTEAQTVAQTQAPETAALRVCSRFENKGHGFRYRHEISDDIGMSNSNRTTIFNLLPE